MSANSQGWLPSAEAAVTKRNGASRWQGREASDGAEDVRFGLPRVDHLSLAALAAGGHRSPVHRAHQDHNQPRWHHALSGRLPHDDVPESV